MFVYAIKSIYAKAVRNFRSLNVIGFRFDIDFMVKKTNSRIRI